MHPAPGSSQQQLQLLETLSQARTGLAVHLPNQQQLVLCPEGSSTTGNLKVVAVVVKHGAEPQQQQQQQQQEGVLLKQE
jgi:hypothetical protein